MSSQDVSDVALSEDADSLAPATDASSENTDNMWYPSNHQAHLAEKQPDVSNVPVLIIGAGPTGLLCSILFAQQNVRSIVVERHAKRLGQPKAHAINPRSLEILRQLGIDTTELRHLGASAEEADKVRFTTAAIDGTEIGSLPYERQDEAVKEFTPEPLLNIPQPQLEQVLWRTALDTGKVTIWREMQWQDCAEFGDYSIISTVLNLRTQKTHLIKSKWLIACDGAHARSRTRFSIPFDTLDGKPAEPIHYCSVNFDADLSKEKSGMLWFIMARDTGKRNFIAYNRSNNWVFVTCYDPEITPKETFTEGYCRQLINQSLGKTIPYKVLNITTWNTTPRIARHYRSRLIRHGLVVGDAAHCFPSTGGLGVNTGLSDAHNLVWKIVAVENGWADNGLLDSYESERIPVAKENSWQSRLNEKKIHELSRAVFGEGGHSVEERMQDSNSRSEIEHALIDNYDHFDSLDLQIGFVYGRERPRHERVGHYTPRCAPGARLPHAWVSTPDGRTVSTLDMTDYSAFTIFQSGSLQQGNCRQLCALGFPAKEVYLGKDIVDTDGTWTRMMGLESGSSAVVVRPDQHILGRVTTVDELRHLVNSYVRCSS